MKLRAGDIVECVRFKPAAVIRFGGVEYTSADPDAGYYFWAPGQRGMPKEGQPGEYAGPDHRGNEPEWVEVPPA